ncbi:hypothetical protein Misp05_13660 [Micromonospora sp. NBRC 107095]|nr:hypothetical protein Misp05_13660 [Micromonospora sp. NBRC 107095]
MHVLLTREKQIRLADDGIVNKHHDLNSSDDLERLLDERVALLTDDHIPEAAVVAHRPMTPTRNHESKMPGDVHQRRPCRSRHGTVQRLPSTRLRHGT